MVAGHLSGDTITLKSGVITDHRDATSSLKSASVGVEASVGVVC